MASCNLVNPAVDKFPWRKCSAESTAYAPPTLIRAIFQRGLLPRKTWAARSGREAVELLPQIRSAHNNIHVEIKQQKHRISQLRSLGAWFAQGEARLYDKIFCAPTPDQSHQHDHLLSDATPRYGKRAHGATVQQGLLVESCESISAPSVLPGGMRCDLSPSLRWLLTIVFET